MRQIVITKHGAKDVLKLKQSDDPQPKRGEVAIRVKASGINFADILARKGLYPDAPKPPCVVGYEVSGVVEMVGEGVDTNLIEKEVVAMTRFGGYSDIVTVKTEQVFEKPQSLSFEQAAAFPVVYLTAYQLVVVMGGLKKDESILIHNAGGGVGLAALDIAKQIGATTYGTASSRKHVFLMKRGLDHAIDYRTQDWSQVLKQLTKGKGVELIIDPLGGKNWKQSYKALRSTGRLGVFGVSSATESKLGKLGLIKLFFQTPKFHPFSMLDSNKGVFGVNVGHLWHEGPKVTEWLKEILNGIENGWVKPYVDKTFPLENAAEAHAYIEQRKNIGKVVLVP